jgi:hypothetical protein
MMLSDFERHSKGTRPRAEALRARGEVGENHPARGVLNFEEDTDGD